MYNIPTYYYVPTSMKSLQLDCVQLNTDMRNYYYLFVVLLFTIDLKYYCYVKPVP